MRIAFVVPIKTISTLNARESWMVKAKRIAKERKATHLLFPPVVVPKLFRVRMTRVSPGELDSDNLAGALKGVQDAIAYRLGVDDGNRGPVIWERMQEKGPAAVRVEIRLEGE